MRRPTKKKRGRRRSVDVGRELLVEKRRNLRGEAVIDGVMPKPGYFVVHEGRRRCYGPLIRVTKRGKLMCKGAFGGKVLYDPNTLRESGYTYRASLPVGEGWSYYVDLDYTTTPPAKWLEAA